MREDDGDSRDGRGRWRKGFCPNPRGRPRKKPEISDADVHYFMNSGITAKINGEERLMSRAELLIHSMFEQAIKGKNAMLARKLFERFEKAEETVALARMQLKAIGKNLLDDYYATGKLDPKLEADYRELAELLHIDIDRPVRRRRRLRFKPKGNWRKNPKPQSLLDLEKAEADAEAALEAEWKASRGMPTEPEEED